MLSSSRLSALVVASLSLILSAPALALPGAAAKPKLAAKGDPKPKGAKDAKAPASSSAAVAPAPTPSAAPTQEPEAPPAAPPATTDGSSTEAAAAPPARAASGWIFDGNLGLPRLKSDETSLAFDVNAGWVGRSWGFGAAVSSYTYALQQDGTLNQTSKMRFGLEARYLSGAAGDTSRYEFKVEANSGAFNTTYISTTLGGGFSTEQSTLNRLTFLLGYVGHTTKLAYKLELGGGLQTDTSFRAADAASSTQVGGGGDTNFSASSSFRYTGRLRVAHRTVPDVLALRGELSASSFQIRRVAFFAGGAQTDADAFKVTEFRETDAGVRLFGDLEKFAFLGLMPGAFVGVDYISVSGADRSSSVLVPIFGVGIINATPRD